MVTDVTVYFVTIKARAVDFKLESFLPYRLNQAAERVSQRFAAQYRLRYHMTRPEWRALAAIGTYGRMTATEIGANSSMHKTKVSRAVRALEEKRWLKRAEHAEDRRVEHLELTPAGKRIYGEMIELAKAYEQELATLLGASGLRQLEAGLTTIEVKMASETSRRGPKD
ncbi:MarR family winged helix-turn-helix transcriptional regulator [Shinella kummerowiae]|jgi:DNA-binding MarR family transcriptional regulator|uniref:MarR family transcriptional regulator n=1 Tax=Shinella kummerowiae TaxID=417745 RepID=A0A6N8SKL2_9HYPH|nr:MarR family transcriptional regulator [Shinella kummerowiae]MCT7666279.1 MarR family transcriptional regulator [Shinella kummerowiae]MXN48278.1 MarR family transcriptional regulator [Shinella kummerowiae]